MPHAGFAALKASWACARHVQAGWPDSKRSQLDKAAAALIARVVAHADARVTGDKSAISTRRMAQKRGEAA